MPNENFLEKQEEGISIHIFSVSATMAGICLAMIGILNITSALNKISTLGDELVAVDAALFLAACVISYVAMRTKTRKTRYLLEKTADIIFLSAIFIIAVTCVLIVKSLL